MSEGSSTCGTEAARRRGAAGALGGASEGLQCGGAPVRGPPCRGSTVRPEVHVLLRSPEAPEAPPPEAPPCAGAGAPRATGGPLPPRPAPPLPGLTALTGSACLAAHQAGVVDELVHLASVRGQARAQGRGQGYASRAPGRRWRACPVLRATSGVGGRLGHLWWEAAWARLRTCATVAWTSRCTRPMAALRRCMISSWSNSWSSEYHVPGRGESEWGQERGQGQGQGQGGASASAQGQGQP